VIVGVVKYSDELKPGERLGKYEILRELATGGMATIYLARVSGTAGFEKLVVLKCILPQLARDKSFLTMFLDEARLAATLRHANIAEVIDVGYEGSTYFFAMEYVHGQNARALRIAAKQRALGIPLEVTLAIVTGTAAALAYAHARTGPDGLPLGLVHRDVSPSNVLVGYEGAVKLVDFGIARATMRRGARTRTGMRKGKAPYMSPEQCRGQPLDGRSDLFSLGTMLYELTTGQRPFQGLSDFDVMDAIVHSQPDPPSSMIPTYPPDLEAIVLRMLATARENRYQTAANVVDDLEAFIARHGLLTSAHVTARFMTELFGEAATSPLEYDTVTTREYPDGVPPPLSDDSDSAGFKRAEQLWITELRNKPRAPPRISTSPPFAAEAEQTHLDPVLPFDPIDARSNEILEHLDEGAPDNETIEARALRRIYTLMEQAQGWLGIGEADNAVTAVELALEQDMHTPATQKALQKHIDVIVQAYEGLLDDPYRVPVLSRSLAELTMIPMEARTRLLLPFIDGEATIMQIVERTGMQRLEAYHHLCQLLLRGIVQ